MFLFGESLSNLEVKPRTQMRKVIKRQHESPSETAPYVNHDQGEVKTPANKVMVMRAVIIEREGAPIEVFGCPAAQFVAGFIGTPMKKFFPVRTARTILARSSRMVQSKSRCRCIWSRAV